MLRKHEYKVTWNVNLLRLHGPLSILQIMPKYLPIHLPIHTVNVKSLQFQHFTILTTNNIISTSILRTKISLLIV